MSQPTLRGSQYTAEPAQPKECLQFVRSQHLAEATDPGKG